MPDSITAPTDPAAASLADVAAGYAATPARRMPGKSAFAEFFEKEPDALNQALAADDARKKPATAGTTPKPNETKNDGQPASGKDAGGDGHTPDHPAHEAPSGEGDEDLSQDEKDLGGPEGGDAGRAFKTLKTKLKEARQQLKTELSKKDAEIKALQSAKGAAETPAELASIRTELETARKERDELSRHLKGAFYKHSPEFTEKFSGRRKAILDMAGATLPKELADQAKSLFSMPPGDPRDNLLEQLADGKLARAASLSSILMQLDGLALDQQREEADADKRYDQYISERRAQAEATQKARQEQFDATFNAALNRIQDKANGIDLYYPKSDAKEESERQEAIGLAKRAWSGAMNPEELATLQLWGARFPALLTQNAKLRAGLDAALAKIKKLEGSTPGVGGPGESGQGATGENAQPKQGESMAEYAARLNPTGRFNRG